MTNDIKSDSVLKKPRITEKAAIQGSERGVHVFEVTPDATRKSVSASIRDAYKVTPERVRLAAIPRKRVLVRGKRGVKGGGKKAYVYLKKGDKIELL